MTPPHALRMVLTRPKQSMPSFIRSALEARGLAAAFRARPPYQQNDYLSWIKRAKQESTKTRRLDQMLDELDQGGVYMRMKWSDGAKPKRKSSNR